MQTSNLVGLTLTKAWEDRCVRVIKSPFTFRVIVFARRYFLAPASTNHDVSIRYGLPGKFYALSTPYEVTW
jgi:hypothetical protein